MSISSMITGIPAPYQSMSYNDFSFLDGEINSFPNILRKKANYDTYGMFFWPDGRKFLGPIWGDTCEKYWDEDLKNRKNEFWSNEDQIKLFKRFVEERSLDSKPFFSWLHLNCRNDPDLSNKVDNLFSYLKSNKLWDDNIIILNSDHGYPDVKRGISYYDKLKHGHDLIMSDDNILAPQLLKLPGVIPTRVNEVISTLDIAPTILEYLGLNDYWDLTKYVGSGRSLFQNLKSGKLENRDFCRVDNRFLFQRNGASVLRNNKYKYINYIDENREEFYDISEDEFEKYNSITNSKYLKIIDTFRKEYFYQNKEIINFHTKRIVKKLDSLNVKRTNAYFIGDNTFNFCNTTSNINKFNKLSVDDELNKLDKFNDFKSFIFDLISYNDLDKNEVIHLFVFPVSKNSNLNRLLERNIKLLKLSGVKIHIVDYNFNYIKNSSTILLNKIYNKPKYYFYKFKHDPKSTLMKIVIDFKRLFKIIFKH